MRPTTWDRQGTGPPSEAARGGEVMRMMEASSERKRPSYRKAPEADRDLGAD